jgi:hypothetical protein
VAITAAGGMLYPDGPAGLAGRPLSTRTSLVLTVNHLTLSVNVSRCCGRSPFRWPRGSADADGPLR